MSKLTRLVPAAFCVLLWPIVGCETTSNIDAQLYDPIQLAVKNGDIAQINALLAQGADPSEKHDRATQFGTMPGLSAFDLAMTGNREDITKILLAHCVAAIAPGKNCSSAMYHAVRIKDAETVKALAFKGADMDGALAFFMDKNDTETVQALLAKGADLDHALHAAAGTNKPEIAKLLMKKGAKVDALNDSGSTALGVAASWGNKEMVEFLLSKGADVNKAGNPTNPDLGVLPAMPPLAAAAFSSHSEVAKLLLAKGAKVKAAQDNLEAYRAWWEPKNNPGMTSQIKEASRLLAELSEK